MAKGNKKKPSKTIRDFRKYRNAHIALKATEYSAPFIPFTVLLGVNWNEWFPKNGNHTSVAIGLIGTLAALLISLVAIAKKDSDFMKKVGKFIPIAVAFVVGGTLCVLLAEVIMEFGRALICTGAGIFATATADVVDKGVISEKYLYLKQLSDDNGLSKVGEWRKNAKAQAEYDGEKKRDTVRYVPHD